MPHHRSRYLLGLAISTEKMDQLDRSQPHGARARPEPLRDVLLFHAICHLHGSHRNSGPARCHLSHLRSHYQFDYHTSKIVSGSHPTHAPRHRFGTSRCPYPHHDAKGHLCRLDDLLSLGTTDLELCPSRILVLAL